MKRITIARAMLIICLLWLLVGCTSTESAKRTLEDEGYTEITMTGYRWFGCGNGDEFSDGFKALAPGTKRQVTGVVCQGWTKGKTVRLD